MLAEQTLLNAGVLTADRDRDRRRGRRLRLQRAADRARAAAALPGRPGLAAPPPRRAGGDRGRATSSSRAIRITILAIAGFAGAVALGLLILGPWAMSILFDDDATYGRFGLAAVALGMGAHLAAGTLNQAALARDHAGAAAAAWLVSARRLRRLDAARRRRRRARARRGRLPRRRDAAVRAARRSCTAAAE